MEHNNDVIISKKSRIMTTVKKFKEEIALHGHKNTKTEIIFFEKAIKFHEELASDEDEDDIMYLNDRIIYFVNLFNDYFIKNNTDQMSEKPIINNSTFIETPTWLKLKRCVLNPQNNVNKCFQYSVALSLYHEQIGKNYCRIPKIKQHTNNFYWNNINFSPQEQDYKTFEMNNKSIAMNVLYVQSDTGKISHLYKSEFNKTREKQSILLILTDDECNSPQKQHYVAVKNLNSLLKDKNKCSEHFCINCFK